MARINQDGTFLFGVATAVGQLGAVLRYSDTGTRPPSAYRLSWSTVGTVTACVVNVLGSLDGITWTTIASAVDMHASGSAQYTDVYTQIKMTVTTFTGTGGVSVLLAGNNVQTGGGSGTVTPATASTLGTVKLANGQSATQLAAVATTGNADDLARDLTKNSAIQFYLGTGGDTTAPALDTSIPFQLALFSDGMKQSVNGGAWQPFGTNGVQPIFTVDQTNGAHVVAVGVTDSLGDKYYFAADGNKVPSDASGFLSGYYAGMAVGSAVTTHTPIFGVGNTAAVNPGLGGLPFSVYADNQVFTKFVTLDDGAGNMHPTSLVLTDTVNGHTYKFTSVNGVLTSAQLS